MKSSEPALTSDGRTFRVQSRWKEEVIYWEGADGFLFDAGWGVEPPVLYIPPAAGWDDAVPDWMAGRRDAVATALADKSGHVVREDGRGYDSRSRAARTLVDE